ncbi:MAG: protein translocase subunit SecF [Alphaproteobacteria bacterium]|jgi:preprotein translocase subunit SecF|nr:protein translocase subunit SecF [Alphaproteobacteria bacterium]
MKHRHLGILGPNVNVDFFKYTRIFFSIAAVLLILSFSYPFIKGYNLGIDFRGGVVIDFINNPNDSLDVIKEKINALNIKDYSIKEFGTNGFQLEISQSELPADKVHDIIENIKKAFTGYTLLQTQFVGPSVSADLLKSGLIATFFSLLGMFIYIWIRYNWQFGLIGVLTLAHDALMSLLFLSLFSFEVNVSTIAAILTVIAYSINDTVVLFDQVRENVRKYIKEDVKFIINKSINQVLSRSIATVMTVVLVLLSIFFLGGAVLKSFSFTLLVGVLFGAYSSICLAVPMLYYIGDIKARELAKGK